jgi:hypothetical protein
METTRYVRLDLQGIKDQAELHYEKGEYVEASRLFNGIEFIESYLEPDVEYQFITPMFNRAKGKEVNRKERQLGYVSKKRIEWNDETDTMLLTAFVMNTTGKFKGDLTVFRKLSGTDVSEGSVRSRLYKLGYTRVKGTYVLRDLKA